MTERDWCWVLLGVGSGNAWIPPCSIESFCYFIYQWIHIFFIYFQFRLPLRNQSVCVSTLPSPRCHPHTSLSLPPPSPPPSTGSLLSSSQYECRQGPPFSPLVASSLEKSGVNNADVFSVMYEGNWGCLEFVSLDFLPGISLCSSALLLSSSKKYILPTFSREMYKWSTENIGYMIIFRVNNLWTVLHTVWCNISGEAAGKCDIDHSSVM